MTNDPGDLGISIVSVYARQVDDAQNEIKGTMYSFWEDELAGMWDMFANAKRIIGFNTVKFDVPALKKYAPATFARLAHFDIMQTVRDALGHYLSLNALATETLNQKKEDVGTNAVV